MYGRSAAVGHIINAVRRVNEKLITIWKSEGSLGHGSPTLAWKVLVSRRIGISSTQTHVCGLPDTWYENVARLWSKTYPFIQPSGKSVPVWISKQRERNNQDRSVEHTLKIESKKWGSQVTCDPPLLVDDARVYVTTSPTSLRSRQRGPPRRPTPTRSAVDTRVRATTTPTPLPARNNKARRDDITPLLQQCTHE